MKKVTITNLVLGLIAGEVVLQTVRAIADRPIVAGAGFPPAEPPKPRTEPRRFLTGEAVRGVMDLVRRWFFNTKAESPETAGREKGERGLSRKLKINSPTVDRNSLQGDELPEAGIQRQGSMEGIAAKLKDPAWAGILAANAGNISLTDAERAVPMPDSAKFVQRLDKNPFVGKGMKDRSRDHI